LLDRELCNVKLKSCEFNFKYSDSKLLEIYLVAYNLKREENFEIDPKMIQKRLIRNIKIEEIIKDKLS
jgi:hypothetical protein